MSQSADHRRWTGAEYLAWEASQRTRHELIDGQVFAMAGAKNRHELLKKDLLTALDARLRGKGPCEPFGSDTKVAVPNGNYRYPDVVVDCTENRDLDSLFAETPRVLFEILSPTNTWTERAARIQDFQSIPACAIVAVVWSTAARIEVLVREPGGAWPQTAEIADGRAAAAVLAALGIELPLEEVYRGFADTDLPD